jgi:histone deacetylase complex regulatory component SIN3
LRIVQISNILPDIVEAYQKMLSFRNHVLQTSGIVISVIAIVLIFAFMDIRKKSKKLSVQRQKLEETNDRISSLNGQLSATNDLREQYIHMFLDLCAANINKFDSYRNLVQRKVKARQTDDLLKYSNTTMLSEQEASEFMEKFDNTFLSLYPRFIVQLNTLLLPECQVVQKDSNRLTPEVRIMALMRLGVMESSAIATLLFYTPRTIYNYRSTMKRGAINRETFENDLVHLSGI